MFALDVRNTTRTSGIVNKRGGPFLLGEVELFFTTPDGRVWINQSNIKVISEVDFPNRDDYVRVAPGESVKIALRLDSQRDPLSAGEYLVHVCYWDQYEKASQFAGGLRVLRGPAVAPLLQLTVKGKSR